VPSYEEVLEGERKMLRVFFDVLRNRIKEAWEASGGKPDLPIIVAHYAGFDVRTIWQRAKILGVTPPVWWPIDYNRYRRDEVQDTMTMWAGHDGHISLDDLCRALGVGGKDDLDGSKVWDAIQQGRLMDVHCYCDDDVERVRRVHRILHRRSSSDDDEIYAVADAAADRDHGALEEVA
jgi:predicted PolB exonuclease-like 3'-5' exonuclease